MVRIGVRTVTQFPEVAPGEYLLWLRIGPKNGSWQSTFVDAHQTVLTVRPGQKLTVGLLLPGRTVIGKAEAATAGAQLDWLTDVLSLQSDVESLSDSWFCAPILAQGNKIDWIPYFFALPIFHDSDNYQ